MASLAQPDTVQAATPQIFLLVHPLDDAAETKLGCGGIETMRLTRTVRFCLFALRGYLWMMFGLLAYWVLQRAGAVR